MIPEFSKGDIVFHYFKTGSKNVIDGPHKSVVLHSHNIDNNTVTICPISSVLDNAGKPKKLKAWHLVLKKEDYPCLDHDSFVKIDQVVTVDRTRVNRITIPTSLTPIDMISLDLKILSLYEMSKTVKSVLNGERIKEIECLIEDIDKELKDQVNSGLTDLLRGVNRKIESLAKEFGIDKKNSEVFKTLLKVDVDVILKVNAIVDEVLNKTKEKYIKKYRC